MLLKELRTDLTIERQILSAMIISDPFMKRFADIIKPVFFESPYIRTIAKWVLQYHKHHKNAPKMTIKDIMDTKISSNDIDEKEASLIEPIINEIINTAAILPDFNHEYHIRTAEEYFTSRNLTLSANKILELVEQKQVGEAEKVFGEYRRVAVEVSPVFNPLDEKEIDEAFEDDDIPFFELPGEWGKYCGKFERGHLVGIMGAFKRGKSWLLQEFVTQAMLQRRRIFFVSLEMNKKQVKKRLYSSLTSTGDKKIYTVPHFDCTFNQRNTCKLVERINTADFPIVDKDDKTIPYDKDLTDYQICNFCRNKRGFKSNYHPSIWYETISRPNFEHRYVFDELRAWDMYKQFVRYAVFPRMSATISDVYRHANMLINEEGFEPDIYLLDYGDIFRGEDERITGYTKEDITWMTMAQMASKMNALVVSPTQVTKIGQTVKSLNVRHQSKWVGVFAHVDGMYSVNQTPIEKRMGIMRWGTVAHRHEDFDPYRQLTILQNLYIGQPYLDSEIIYPLKEDE